VSRVLGWILGLVALVAVYGVMNLVLVGGQYVWYYADNQKLEARLQQMEKDLAGSASQIEAVKAGIKAVEKANPRGIPEDKYAAYSRSVRYHNELVEAHNQKVAEQQVVHGDYSSRVDQFNGLVEEANSLAKKIGGTWYVVPMPRAGGKASAKQAH